ncbi:MAG TPA: hypothetical protein PLX35_10990 [Cyclobacteriaceae bacterium]|nr:hypothetical protein [Cyclobacteriaceae bacterium]HQQ97784.1 hypothetical protein [Cyclobacteriaceae bacterium]
MNRSQKLFAFLALLFALLLIGMVIDISRKTTFPGKRNKAKQAVLQGHTVIGRPDWQLNTV